MLSCFDVSIVHKTLTVMLIINMIFKFNVVWDLFACVYNYTQGTMGYSRHPKDHLSLMITRFCAEFDPREISGADRQSCVRKTVMPNGHPLMW